MHIVENGFSLCSVIITGALVKFDPFVSLSLSLALHFGQQAVDEISDRHKSRLSMSYDASQGSARKWPESIVWTVETIGIFELE